MAGPAVSMLKFITTLQRIYQFPTHLEEAPQSTIKAWSPPQASAGHNGRYLWTDAFGVLNFITLYKLSNNWPNYLEYAKVLITIVHSTLGRTRDLTSQLPGATLFNIVGGGLRSGNLEETGIDGDGQYHHFLTLWMFALNRLSIATQQKQFNDQAIALAKVIHPVFVYDRDTDQPKMYSKFTVDLKTPLLSNQDDNLDAAAALVIFRLLQEYDGPTSRILQQEISDYEKIWTNTSKTFASSDPQLLGRALWTGHWFADKEDWARELVEYAEKGCQELFDQKTFDGNRPERTAYVEFGVVLGLNCASESKPQLLDNATKIIKGWEGRGVVPVPHTEVGPNANAKRNYYPMTAVTYAAALLPGAFHRNFI